MPYFLQAWQDTLAEAGLQIDINEFSRATTGKKSSEIIRLMLGAQLSDTEVVYWGERKEALYRERFSDYREPLPGLLQLLWLYPWLSPLPRPLPTSLLSWTNSTYAAILRS